MRPGEGARLTCHRTQWTAFAGPQDTVEDYRVALADHVASRPDETYCCHRVGYRNISPAVLSTWMERAKLFQKDSGDALGDELRKYIHQARIGVGEALLSLRQRFRRRVAE